MDGVVPGSPVAKSLASGVTLLPSPYRLRLSDLEAGFNGRVAPRVRELIIHSKR